MSVCRLVCLLAQTSDIARWPSTSPGLMKAPSGSSLKDTEVMENYLTLCLLLHFLTHHHSAS